MKKFSHYLSWYLLLLFWLTACRKPIEEGTNIFARGIVFDHVKNKPLPNAKVYLYGAKSTFYGTYYVLGPFDSVISDNDGKFEIHYVAEGTSVDYGLTLSYDYDQQTNYIMGDEGIFRFNYYKTVLNAEVRARELNYTKLHLKVDNNPYDSFYVNTETTWFETLIKGQRIDTTIYLRHLPISHTIIQYYTQSSRDTIGLGALNAGAGPNDHHYGITRILTDTIIADWADTLTVSKTIPSTLSMPRR